MIEPKAAYAGRVKYTEKKARSYQNIAEFKHLAEMRLVDRAFAYVPKTHRVLDVPCGGGRVTLHLARQDYTLSAADLSDAMLQIARETMAANQLAVPVEKQDVEHLTCADRSFDTIISFRLFHHFPTPGIRQRVVSELCRVARQYVVLSYFSPLSFTSLKRRWRAARSGREPKKFSTPLREVESYFAKAGFRLVKDFARLPLVHTLHLALFERSGENQP